MIPDDDDFGADFARFEPDVTPLPPLHAPDEPEVPSIERKAKAGTEDMAAQRFTERYGNSMKFDHSRGRWFQWEATRWVEQKVPVALEYARRIGREAGGNGKASFAAGAAKLASADPRHAVEATIWDADPWLLGTPDGTIDLRTGSMKRANAGHFITKQTTVGPSSEEPTTWLKFLAQATAVDGVEAQPDVIAYLQRLCGYCLTGDTSEQAMLFVHGPGGSGKGMFMNTITSIMGDYAKTSPMETFTLSKHSSHPTELAMLAGARLVTASETQQGRAWNQQRLTQVTGGDAVTARFMREDFFTYTPQFKLLVFGNYSPALTSADEAMKRRFNMIAFPNIPKKKDLRLREKLWAEAPQILGWMIRGCLDWQKRGLDRPESVELETSRYFEEQNLFKQWLDDKCIVGPIPKGEYPNTSGQLFNSWKLYAKEAGQYDIVGTSSAFLDAMRKAGFKSFRTSRLRGFEGIVLKRGEEPGAF